MTEYELQVQEVLTATSLASVEVFAYYTTVLGSYLIVAYLAGKQLTTTQAFIISVLFVFSSLMGVWSAFAYMARAVELADALELLHPDKTYGAQPFAQKGMAVVMTLGVVACLRFMWEIRHPKTE